MPFFDFFNRSCQRRLTAAHCRPALQINSYVFQKAAFSLGFLLPGQQPSPMLRKSDGGVDKLRDAEFHPGRSGGYVSVGCGQLLHCHEPCSRVPLIWGSCRALGDCEQDSSIVVIDKNLSLFGNVPRPTLHAHWFSIGWLILAETRCFRRRNHRKRFGVSVVGEEMERGE